MRGKNQEDELPFAMKNGGAGVVVVVFAAVI
jgi:hypothetical protein